MNEPDCRIDVWLWRARFFKTRPMAAAFVESGRVRRLRTGQEARLDKASRSVRLGDQITFALAGKLICVTVQGLGHRRAPPNEARGLYEPA